MRNPVIALLWQCWRLSRRWYVLIMAIAIAANLSIMNSAPANTRIDLQFYQTMQATNAAMLSFVLANFSALIALTVSGRAGFPLRFEYRLPVDLKLLTAIPLLYMSLLCGSLYVVPVLLSRLFVDLPIPLAAPALLIAISVATLAAASWSTTGTLARTLAVIAACFGLIQLYGWLYSVTPVAIPGPGAGPFNPGANRRSFLAGISSLTWVEYGLLIMLFMALFAFIVRNLNRQRYNESWLPSLKFTLKAFTQSPHDAAPVAAQRRNKPASTFIGKLGDAFDVPCPLSSPWRAELWFEMKQYGVRVLTISALLALGIPPLLLFAKLIGVDSRENLAWLPVAGVFFTGIGISFINRRQDNSGYMDAFEGTRGMGTLQLAGIHFLVAGVTTLAGVLLTSTSLWLSLPLLDEPGAVIARTHELLAARDTGSVVTQASEFITAITLYVALIAALACLHACSVFWGRKVLYGTMIFALYCMLFTFMVVRGDARLEDIQQHMWGFAGVVLLLTLFMLGRVLYLKALSLNSGITGLAGWGIFLLCAWISLQARGIELTSQAPELLAFNTALLTLPFTLFLLTAWSYDRLRHR